MALTKTRLLKHGFPVHGGGGGGRMYPRSSFRSGGTCERALVPVFRSGGTSERTLVPVFVPGEHPPKPPFGNNPFGFLRVV